MLNLPYSKPLYHFFNKYYATGPLCDVYGIEITSCDFILQIIIGGYSLGREILKSSEVHTISRNWTQRSNLQKINDMDVAR